MRSRIAPVLAASALALTLLGVLAMQATGASLGDLGADLALPLAGVGASFGFMLLLVATSAARRTVNRRRRAMVRYQLVLSQADEAPLEEVATACEQLVQTIRTSLTQRLAAGQPWLALESWFVPPRQPGETGTAALMLLCERGSGHAALAALRHAYPDLSLRADPSSPAGAPFEFVRPTFVPSHVIRVRKVRSWALPIGGSAQSGASRTRSAMAGVIRQQQQAARLSCVRWCILPAADQYDSRAAEKLERVGHREQYNAAASSDVQSAVQGAGGAMSFVELQVAIEAREVSSRSGRTRRESWGELQNAARQLLSPALSQRGANHLTERLMWVRQRLYCRRWARGEPPLLPDLARSTLMSPRELALMMELPSLGSEHALPLQRNTVPHLPLPPEVARARIVDLDLPPREAIEPASIAEEAEEVVSGELVFEDREKVPR